MMKLFVALCVVNVVMSRSSGWDDDSERKLVPLDEGWSIPGSASDNSRVLLGKKSPPKDGNGDKSPPNKSPPKDQDDEKKKKPKPGGKPEPPKKKKPKKKKKKKPCDDDNTQEPFWSTDFFWSTDDSTGEPFWTTDLEDEEVIADPSTEPTDSPSSEPTVAPSKEPTEGPTSVPTVALEATSEPPTPTPSCPNFEEVTRDQIPCECYTANDCPTNGDECYLEGDTCSATPEFVALLEEREDSGAAQAIAVEEGIATTSQTDHGLLIAALLVGVAVTAIVFGVGIYLRGRKKKYGGIAGDANAERDGTAGIIDGASKRMVWETDVIAVDEEEEIFPPHNEAVRV